MVDTFGLALGGRPRRTVARANFSGQPSVERSGATSCSEPGAVERSFPFMAFLTLMIGCAPSRGVQTRTTIVASRNSIVMKRSSP